MTTYIALLRGINVGRHRRVPMADLRELCGALGFDEIATYVQSGNVVFASEAAADDVRQRLEAALVEHFGFAVDVTVRTGDEFAAVAKAHPFADRQADHAKLHVFFLADDPDAARVAAFDATRFAPDELVVSGREVYVHYPNGAGRSKLAFDFGVPATARNWRSVQALLELAAARS